MNYIVLDLEFNQNYPPVEPISNRHYKNYLEIIQIGAIKIDFNFNTVSTFNRYIKPTIYTSISPYITELTNITTSQLLTEETFPNVFDSFMKFIGEKDSIFCIWGMSDIKELFENANFHQLNCKSIPRLYVNVQPYVSIHFDFPFRKLLGLQFAVETLGIPVLYEFHNALNDAYYTAEIFKTIYNSSLQPKIYDPTFIIRRPTPRKREIDYDNLIIQFEKMFSRKMTNEEQEIIKLAYKMGKTNQFLK